MQGEELPMTGFGKTLPVLFALVCRGALGVGGYFALEFLAYTAEHVWAEFQLATQLLCLEGLILIHDARYAHGTVE